MLQKLRNSYFSYFLMYNFYYLSWAIFSVLISVYLMDKGYKPSEVSLVVSASFLSSMVCQPIIGMISDRNDIRKVNMVLFFLAAIGGLLFMAANNLFLILIGYSFVLTLLNSTNPIMEKIATSSPYQYGKIRIWGTIGYALGSQLAGILYQYISPSSIFVCFTFTMALTILGTYLTDPKPAEKKSENKVSTLSLFKNKKYLYYLMIYALFTGVTSTGHTYAPSMFQADGLEMSFISTILSVAVLCELPLVFFSNKFMENMGNKTLIIIAFVMVIAQYGIYCMNMPMVLKIIITLLCKHPAGMLFIMINLKVVYTLVDHSQQITALAFAATLKNLSSILFQNVLGSLLDTHTYAFMYAICLGFMVIGLVMVIFFRIDSGKGQNLFN